MKTTIVIKGQISGNFRLLSAIQTSGSESHQTNFNGFKIVFRTKKEAKKALWEGFKYLKNEEPDFARGGILYSKYGTLRYDASCATIED